MQVKLFLSMGILISLSPTTHASEIGYKNYKQNLMTCLNDAKLKEHSCRCIINVSDSLEKNDGILKLYFSSRDKTIAKQKYIDLIEGDEFIDYPFKSMKEKDEFIQGKSLLFAREILKKCRL